MTAPFSRVKKRNISCQNERKTYLKYIESKSYIIRSSVSNEQISQ